MKLKKCLICGKDMDFKDGEHRWGERIWFCEDCKVEIIEDITGELIDNAEYQRGDR